jgi:hypothetical protein
MYFFLEKLNPLKKGRYPVDGCARNDSTECCKISVETVNI